ASMLAERHAHSPIVRSSSRIVGRLRRVRRVTLRGRFRRSYDHLSSATHDHFDFARAAIRVGGRKGSDWNQAAERARRTSVLLPKSDSTRSTASFAVLF